MDATLQKKIKNLESKWFVVNIEQEIETDRMNSFWYNGIVATIEKDWEIAFLSTKNRVVISVDYEIIYTNSIIQTGSSQFKLPFSIDTWTDQELEDLDHRYQRTSYNWFSMFLHSNPDNYERIDDPLEFFEEDIIQSLKSNKNS